MVLGIYVCLCVCVCLSVRRDATARISLGGEGNALYPVLASFICPRLKFGLSLQVSFIFIFFFISFLLLIIYDIYDIL